MLSKRDLLHLLAVTRDATAGGTLPPEVGMEVDQVLLAHVRRLIADYTVMIEFWRERGCEEKRLANVAAREGLKAHMERIAKRLEASEGVCVRVMAPIDHISAVVG